MAWTTPRTWVDDEVVTAALLNTHIRDNVSFLAEPLGAKVFMTERTQVATGAYTTVSWPVASGTRPSPVAWDTGSCWSSGNPSRLTTGRAGKWRISGWARWKTDSVGLRGCRLRFNGSGTSVAVLGQQDACGESKQEEGTVVGGSQMFDLASTDYVELQARQDSGGNLRLKHGSNNVGEPTRMMLLWMSN
jgi:hypothetical protein